MGMKKSIAIMMAEISECHIVAYATVAMDKFILLYLLLLRRLKNPEMNMLEILGQIHWSNIIRLVTISPNSPGWPREYFVTTSIAFITMFDLLFTAIMVISIRKKVLMGYIPWIVFRGIIAFGLLICGLVFTINQLKGDILDHSNVHADVNTLKDEIKQSPAADFGLTNLVLLWFLVLFIGWIFILREFKKESSQMKLNDKVSGDNNQVHDCACASLIVEMQNEKGPFRNRCISNVV